MKKNVGNRYVHPMPSLPPIPTRSPLVVLTLDRIRSDLKQKDAYETHMDEFIWWAREYPRCYRHYLECAAFRLRTIHKHMSEIHTSLAAAIATKPSTFEIGFSNHYVKQIYWDFESYLSQINSSLDLLARIVGLAFHRQTPPNFNRLCKTKEPTTKMLELMRTAQLRWVKNLKAYRDCFTHFTPVDTMLSVRLVQYCDGFHIRAKLPTNPNVREILDFRYSRRVELFKYASTVWRHMMALDRTIATEIAAAYKRGDYPKRITGLFYVS